MIQLYFSEDEMKQFLEKHGFAVRLDIEKMAQNIYHNDVEYFDCEVWVVYKDQSSYKKPHRDSFGRTDWLEAVFTEELQKSMLWVL